MPRSARALLFDLDDTLYPIRRFRRSGFAAVARFAARVSSVDEETAFRCLVRTSRGPDAGRELDRLVERFALNVTVPQLVRIVRAHRPTMRLPRATVETLARLRDDGWQLAIVTNGIPEIQRTKIGALGLESLVDAVVYAPEHGSGEGKPDREPFVEALRQVDIDPTSAIFVGDDLIADIFGAARCGLRTIETREWKRKPYGPASIRPDAIVNTIREVPAAASRLLPAKQARHAA